jgi:hypothetical protein
MRIVDASFLQQIKYLMRSNHRSRDSGFLGGNLKLYVIATNTSFLRKYCPCYWRWTGTGWLDAHSTASGQCRRRPPATDISRGCCVGATVTVLPPTMMKVVDSWGGRLPGAPSPRGSNKGKAHVLPSHLPPARCSTLWCSSEWHRTRRKIFRVKTSTQAPRTSKSHILSCQPLPLEPNGRRIDFAAGANLGLLAVSLWIRCYLLASCSSCFLQIRRVLLTTTCHDVTVLSIFMMR